MFIAEGPKLADELLNSNYHISQIYATKKWLEKNNLINIETTEISDMELSRISNLTTPNDVLMLVHQETPDQEPILEGRLTLVLDGIRDPGNMGTIIRIADWFGIEQIICSNDCVEMYNPKVVQATMGSFARVTCWYKNVENWNFSSGVPVFGALLEGENIYFMPRIKEGILIIGNEGKGIGGALRSKINRAVTIPRIGGAESLNAAVATGIIAGCLLNGRKAVES